MVLPLRVITLPVAYAASYAFNPVADSYVNSAYSTTNYGTSTQFRVDGSPTVNSYLRFDVSGLSGTVTKATLRIYANSNQSLGFGTRSVTDNSWQETTINYSNAPIMSTTITGSSGAVAAGTWKTVDVTPLVIGNGTYSFGLATTNSTALSLASRESVNKPELIVETSDTVPTPSPIPSPSPTPTPTPPPAGDPVVMAVGDMVCGAGSGAACKQMEVSQLILDGNPSAFLALGDVQYESGEIADFQNFYTPSYGRFLNLTKPSIGNHEYNDPVGSSDPSKVGYWDYFNGVGNYTGIAGDRDKGYYSFNVGSWHLIALNSNCSKVGGCSAGSPQYTWLQNDLVANAGAKCTLAYFHHPLFTSGSRASTGVIPFWQLLYDNNADMILVGHEHNYERFAPMDPNGNLDTARGLKQFIVGTGGRNLTHLVSAAPNSELFNDTSFGALKMSLHDGSYDWQFVPIPGNTLADSGTATCHDAGASPTPTPTTQTLTFTPIDDAYVQDSQPTVNFGSATTVQTDNSPVKRFLLKFQVAGVGTGKVVSVKLRLRNVDSSNNGGNFFRIADTLWSEGTVTASSQPAFDASAFASMGSVTSGNWYEVNATPVVAGDGTFSFGVSSTSSNGADYSSKEGANAPQLVVTFSP